MEHSVSVGDYSATVNTDSKVVRVYYMGQLCAIGVWCENIIQCITDCANGTVYMGLNVFCELDKALVEAIHYTIK
jgi:hypothetical protein